MLTIIYTDTPRMGKALRALKTWPEISAEHLERSDDLGRFGYHSSFFSFVFPLSPTTQWPKSLLKYTSLLFTQSALENIPGLCKDLVSRKVFQMEIIFNIYMYIFFFSILKDLTRLFSIALCTSVSVPLGSDWWFSQLSLLPLWMAKGTGV